MTSTAALSSLRDAVRRLSPWGRPIIDAAFRADPYPTYAALREAGPIHWSDEFFGGAWLLTRHADVEAVLRDAVRFSAQRTGGWVMQSPAARSELKDFQQLFARAMLFVDAPDHTRIRGVLNAGFRSDVLQQFVPAIERRVDALLDAVDADEGFDFMQALARPLPAEVMAMLMDIPAADRGDFIAWSDDLATFIGAPLPSLEQARRARTSLLAMSGYFEQLVPQRRRTPGDDLVSRLLRAEAAGDIQPGAELLAQCAMLLFAGHETTRNLLGNGLQALLATRTSGNACSATRPCCRARCANCCASTARCSTPAVASRPTWCCTASSCAAATSSSR